MFFPAFTRPFTAPIKAVIPATAERVDGLKARKASSRVPTFFSVCEDWSATSFAFFLNISRFPEALTTPLESTSRTNLLMSALRYPPC